MANQSMQVEYHPGLKPLEQALSKVRRWGDFFVQGKVEAPMPKLEVEGVGVISFPVPAMQVRQLIECAERAPYGRGEETILDTSVRKVWQLPPAKVRLGGKSWAASFQGILEHVALGLGCEVAAVSAELYKMLVYDSGAFFTAHRDTEKTDGMFGTLVLALPSAHRGGELVIRHAGREVTVDLSATEASELAFAAFYADCEHEVRPIVEGNRVCLIYNLVQRREHKRASAAPTAPLHDAEVSAAAECLAEAMGAPEAPPKIAWLLEHQYSPEGLSFAGLKNADAARAQVLAKAAAQAGCVAHLGIVHIEESGPAESNYGGGYGYGRRSRWRSYDEEEVEEDASSKDFTIIEVSDCEHYIDHWVDPQDRPMDFGKIPLGEGELLPDGALDDEQPDEQRLTEATGNEGASFERSYHRAAVVLWRHERYAEVLLQAGVAAALPYLKERIEACDTKQAASAGRTEAVALARQLVDAWSNALESPSYRQPAPPDQRDEMLRQLRRLGDVALLGRFIAEVVTRAYDGSDNAALASCVRPLGAKQTGKLYAELIRQHWPRWHGHCVDLLHNLVFKSRLVADEVGRAALREIAEAAVSKLDEVGQPPTQNQWMDWRASDKVRPVDATLVANLLDVLHEVGAPDLRAAAATKFAARPMVFDPVTILVPALGILGKWDAAAKRLWEHSVDFLLERSGRPPEAPKDWRQDVKLSCACADCRELQAFTRDPAEQTHRFRVREDRRQHLEQQIVHHHLDMTRVTEHKGSPKTLVCTKDRRTYKGRCDQYGKDIAALGSLAEQASTGNPDALTRIAAARALAKAWTPA